jgi:hypothetical protein
VKAYDPYGALPPGEEQLMALVELQTNPTALADLHRQLASRNVFGKERLDQVDAAGLTVGLIARALGDLTSWFALGGLLTPPRDHLFNPRVPGQPVGTGQNAAPLNLAGQLLLRLGEAGMYEGWLDEEDEKALAYVTLWSRYEQLTKEGSMLTTMDKPPEGAPKEMWTMTQRTMRIVHLGKALTDSIRIARMREASAILVSPAFAPLLEYVSADVRERAVGYATRLMAMKVHPWIAEAERMRLPAKRYTEWGNASHSFGLSGGPGGMWSEFMTFANARTGEQPLYKDIWSFITDESEGGFVAVFIQKAREFFITRDMMDQAMLAQAEAALGLTTPGAPPTVHLHGQTWKALVQTGSMASEPIADVLTLMLRPRFTLLNAEGWSHLSGNTDALLYNAMYWTTGQNSQMATKPLLARPAQNVPLYVQPQHPAHIHCFGLRELTPEMILAVTDDNYFGDEDAVFRPFTVAGAAGLLGFASEEALMQSVVMAKLGHLFVRKGQGYAPREDVKATRIFHSSRTRQPWRRPVLVPTNAMPNQVMAMDARTSPTLHDIETVVIRTPDQPSMTAATFALADSAAQLATKNLGVTL